MPAPHVLGHLEYLWATAYECGEPRIGDMVSVELAAAWVGEPGKLCKVLLECGGEGRAGFIEPMPGQPGIYQIHDLHDHAPDYVQARARKETERKRIKTCAYCGSEFRSTEARAKFCSNACRQAMYRNRGVVTERDEGLRNSDAGVMERYAPPAPAPAPAPAPKDIPTEVCSQPPQAATSEPAFLTFPTVGGGPKTWDLTRSKVAEYKEAYPGVDVEAECRRALQWTRDNAAKQKTPRGMPAFLNRWLSSAQNNSAGVKQNGYATSGTNGRTNGSALRPTSPARPSQRTFHD
jgi:hypothetical protein